MSYLAPKPGFFGAAFALLMLGSGAYVSRSGLQT